MQAARQVNDSKPPYVVERVRAMTRSCDRIACLGLAYKADTDDLRESPAVQVATALALDRAGELLVVEPNQTQLPEVLSELGARQVELEQALAEADVLVLLVDHRQFRNLDPAALSGKRVYDARGIWPRYRSVRPEEARLTLRAVS